MIDLSLVILVITAICINKGVNSNPGVNWCHQKPCWMDLNDVGASFPGEPYDHEGDKELFLVRMQGAELGKCILSERKIIPLAYATNFTSDMLIEILFSPPGTIGWVETTVNALLKGPPANALNMLPSSDSLTQFLCRPMFPIDHMDVDADPGIVAVGVDSYPACLARYGFCGQKDTLDRFLRYHILVNPLDSGEHGGEPSQIYQCPKSSLDYTDRKKSDKKIFYIVQNEIKMPQTDPWKLASSWSMNQNKVRSWSRSGNQIKGRKFAQQEKPCWMAIDGVTDKLPAGDFGPEKYIVRFGKQPDLIHFGQYNPATMQIIPLGFDREYTSELDFEILYVPPGSIRMDITSQADSIPGNALKVNEDAIDHEFLCNVHAFVAWEYLQILPPGMSEMGIVDTHSQLCNVRFDFCQRHPKVVAFQQFSVFVKTFESEANEKPEPIGRCAGSIKSGRRRGVRPQANSPKFYEDNEYASSDVMED